VTKYSLRPMFSFVLLENIYIVLLAVAIVAVSNLYFYISDNRCYDLRGLRLPGPNSHFERLNFFTVLRQVGLCFGFEWIP
jgi:hypothetical protein